MTQMPPDLLPRYLADPVGTDTEVRQRMGVPHDRYYTVSVWPVPGQLRVNTHLVRVTHAAKISKSDQG